MSLHYFFSYVSSPLSFVRGLGVSSTARAARATWSHTFPFGSTGTFPEKFHVKASSQARHRVTAVIETFSARGTAAHYFTTQHHARGREESNVICGLWSRSLCTCLSLLLLFGIPLPNTSCNAGIPGWLFEAAKAEKFQLEFFHSRRLRP